MIVAFIIIKQQGEPDAYISTDMDNCVRRQNQEELFEMLCRPSKPACEFRTFQLSSKYTAENFCARTLMNIPRELQGRPVLYPVFTELWNSINK